MDRKNLKMIRVVGARGNGLFGNVYAIVHEEGFIGRRYDIRGIYNLIRQNSANYFLSSEVEEDLERYLVYRNQLKKDYEEMINKERFKMRGQ